MFRINYITGIALLSGLLSMAVVGCAPTYRDIAPGTVLQIDQQPQISAVVERQIDTIPLLDPEPAPPAAYLIGPGDLLAITVYGRPELGSGGGMAAAGPAGAAAVRPSGSRVDETGSVRLPLIGSDTQRNASLAGHQRVFAKTAYVCYERRHRAALAATAADHGGQFLDALQRLSGAAC